MKLSKIFGFFRFFGSASTQEAATITFGGQEYMLHQVNGRGGVIDIGLNTLTVLRFDNDVAVDGALQEMLDLSRRTGGRAVIAQINGNIVVGESSFSIDIMRGLHAKASRTTKESLSHWGEVLEGRIAHAQEMIAAAQAEEEQHYTKQNPKRDPLVPDGTAQGKG